MAGNWLQVALQILNTQLTGATHCCQGTASISPPIPYPLLENIYIKLFPSMPEIWLIWEPNFSNWIDFCHVYEKQDYDCDNRRLFVWTFKTANGGEIYTNFPLLHKHNIIWFTERNFLLYGNSGATVPTCGQSVNFSRGCLAVQFVLKRFLPRLFVSYWEIWKKRLEECSLIIYYNYYDYLYLIYRTQKWP